MNDCILFKQERPFIKYRTNDFDKQINELFNNWAFSDELEYLIHYKKGGLIEPDRGWYLNDQNEVIRKSLPYGERNAEPMVNYILYRKRNILKMKVGVSLRSYWFNFGVFIMINWTIVFSG